MVPAISFAYEQPESDIMLRPPRDAEVDRLVTDKLIMFAYAQIGMFQALAGFYAFFVVLNDYGFRMGDVIGSALDFEAFPLNDNDSIRDSCPCGKGQDATGENFDSDDYYKIVGGSLMTSETKGGNTESYMDTSAIAACPDSALGAKDIDGVTVSADWPFGYGCPFGSVKPAKKCKFGDGWTASPCYKATWALRCAQTAAFISIVVVQMAGAVSCKTRLLSFRDQGMTNSVMLGGYCSVLPLHEHGLQHRSDRARAFIPCHALLDPHLRLRRDPQAPHPEGPRQERRQRRGGLRREVYVLLDKRTAVVEKGAHHQQEPAAGSS
jgi:hypothetical protein